MRLQHGMHMGSHQGKLKGFPKIKRIMQRRGLASHHSGDHHEVPHSAEQVEVTRKLPQFRFKGMEFQRPVPVEHERTAGIMQRGRIREIDLNFGRLCVNRMATITGNTTENTSSGRMTYRPSQRRWIWSI